MLNQLSHKGAPRQKTFKQKQLYSRQKELSSSPPSPLNQLKPSWEPRLPPSLGCNKAFQPLHFREGKLGSKDFYPSWALMKALHLQQVSVETTLGVGTSTSVGNNEVPFSLLSGWYQRRPLLIFKTCFTVIW